MQLWFLGGLSLHLNHCIGSCMAISFRQFGTLPIGIFLSNLVSRQLETSPRTPWGQFWHMSIFGNFRVVWVLWPKSGVFRKSTFSLWRSNRASKCLGVVGGQVPRLYGDTIFQGGATPWGHLAGLRVQRFHFWKSMSNFFDPPKFRNFDP